MSVDAMPRLGMGTWHMGESAPRRREEVAALRLALDLGIRLIDTAEMYGTGGDEKVTGEAIRGRREQAYVVSKFYPHHASRKKLFAACDASLARLGIERLDCYLYHWRGGVPLEETVTALGELVDAGKIVRWGVSNFDVADLEELVAIPGGDRVAVNQVLYNLARRGVEFDLLPWCLTRGIEVMAYSPLDEGRLPGHRALTPIALRLGVTPAQLAMAWTLRSPGVVPIPKASLPAHVREIASVVDLALDPVTLAEIDRAFAPPRHKTALEMV
jgi:diketogulonate reductase-like aldo/keto reductase